jgi:hypothetical protein
MLHPGIEVGMHVTDARRHRERLDVAKPILPRDGPAKYDDIEIIEPPKGQGDASW